MLINYKKFNAHKFNSLDAKGKFLEVKNRKYHKVHSRRNEYSMTTQINAKEWNFIVKFLPRKEIPNEFIN